MPSTQLVNAGIHSGWPLGESGWDIEMNANLTKLDALLSPYMLSGVTDIPGAPTPGDRYIIPAAATGDWAGQDNNIARYNGATWDIFPVIKNWIAFVEDSGIYVRYDGADWVVMFSSGGISDAPINGKAHARKDAGWVPAIATSGSTLVELTETLHTMADAEIDVSNGTWQSRTLAANETLTFTIAQGQSVFIIITPGANTLSLVNVDEWVGSSAPASIAAKHLFIFWSEDGVTVNGNSIGVIS